MSHVFETVTGTSGALAFKFNGQFALKNYTVEIVNGNRLRVVSTSNEMFSLLEADVSEVEINGTVYSDPVAAQFALTTLVHSDAEPVVLTKEQYMQLAEAVQSADRGKILPDTPAPSSGWQPGWYTPGLFDIYAPGTNYPNQNNLKAKKGFITRFLFNGVTWDFVEYEMPKGSQSLRNFANIPSGDFPLVNSGADKVQVVHNESMFQLKDGEPAASSDVPGVSDKWTVVGLAYEKSNIIGKNLANPLKSVVGKYVNWDNGLLADNPSYDAFFEIAIDGDTDYYLNTSLLHFAWMDENKTYISGQNLAGSSSTIKSPINARYFSFSVPTASASVQLEKGITGTVYEPYAVKENITVPNIMVTASNTDFIRKDTFYGKNRFNKSNVINGKFVNAFTGALNDNVNYLASDFCFVKDLSAITLTALIHIAFYTQDKVYISGRDYGGDTINVPDDAVYCRVSLNDNLLDIFQIESGTSKTAYEPFTLPYEGYVIDNLIIDSNGNLPENKCSIITPSLMYWASGRQMNIYFDSAIYPPVADNLSSYLVSVISPRGKFLQNKLRVFPVDDFSYSINVEDKDGLLKTKSLNVSTASVNSGNGQTRKILTIGDSTVNAGETLNEVKTFFDADGMNVTFLGTRNSYVNHEGRGGWTVNDYATAGRVLFKFNYSSGNVSKDSVYSVNGSQYTITEVNVGYFSAQKTSGTNNPTSSGILTKVSGIGDASITYSSFELVDGNPFWNFTTQKFDLEMYLTNTSQTMGNDDWIFFQLAINDLFSAALGNNMSSKIDQMKSQLNSMISEIHSYNPNIRVGIIQTIPPAISQDATGNLLNSGYYNLEYYVKKGLLPWWNELLETYDNTASRNNKVYLVGATSIIDRVNNYPTITEPLDSHNSTQVKVQNNDVHPDVSGYKQIADAYIGIVKYFG